MVLDETRRDRDIVETFKTEILPRYRDLTYQQKGNVKVCVQKSTVIVSKN